jgi:hypothetical protein
LRPIPATLPNYAQAGQDRVDRRRPRPDEQLSRPMQHQHRLLVTVLTGTKRIVGRLAASQIAFAEAGGLPAARRS